MKKIVAKIICVLLVVSLAIAGLVGCAEPKWEGTVTLKNSGAVVKNGNGGFIAETENYIYFINGQEVSTASNLMGTPIKGALMVADKNNPSKSEIVVPKLMVASDYNSGVFIDGGYAYYGTPNVEKDSSGDVASYQLMFMRTKLDGSGETDSYFTLSAISSEYRIVKTSVGVCIYYYENSAIKCYNTSTKKTATIIKTDDKADEFTLDKYIFLKTSEIDDVVAYFTATVYATKYDENAAQGSGYTRTVANYNRIYAIKAGVNTPELVLDGALNTEIETDDTKYAITLIDDGFVFFSATNKGSTKNYALTLIDSYDYAKWKTATQIENADYLVSTNMFISLDNVIVMGENKVYKTTLLTKDAMTKKPILEKDGVNKMLFVRNEAGVDYLYYYDELSQITKVDITSDSDEVKEIRISEAGVLTTWYAPEIIKIGTEQKDCLFYCDGTSVGKAYIKYVDLGAEVKEEDTDDDGVNDLSYIDVDQIKSIGKIKTADMAAIFDYKIEKLKTELPEDGLGLDEEKDAEFFAKYEKLKDEYDALSTEVKNLVNDEILTNINKAFEVVEKYKELEGIQKCVDAEDAENAGIAQKYQQVKDYLVAFKKSASRDEVDALIHNNLKANYTKAVKILETEN